MNIWLKSLLAGSAVALMVFFSYDKLSSNKKEKRFDIHYTISATPDTNSKYAFSLPRVVQVLKRRLEEAEYRFKIKNEDPNIIRVSLTDVTDTVSPRPILISTARLQMREAYTALEVPTLLNVFGELITAMRTDSTEKPVTTVKTGNLSKEVSDLLDSIDKKEKQETAPPGLVEWTPAYQDPETGKAVYYAEIGTVMVKDTAAVRELFETNKIKSVTPPDLQLYYGQPEVYNLGKKENARVRLYFLKTKGQPGKAVLENEDISNAWTDFDQYANVEIRIQFNRSGTSKWAVMTERNVGRPIAILIDGIVLSAPNVESPITNGACTISGGYTHQEAQNISLALKSQRLPAELSILSTDIQPLESSNTGKKWVLSMISFLLFSGLAFFIVKTLKST